MVLFLLLLMFYLGELTLHNYKMRGAAEGNLYYTKVNSTKYGVC